MNNTPKANRIHIGFFGKCNSGKSSLVNALTGQSTAIVSDIAGTTTDSVTKSMEIRGVGAVALIDTAGLDDVSQLGRERISKARSAADKTDVAVFVCADDNVALELEWINMFRNRKTPVVVVLNKIDVIDNIEKLSRSIETQTGYKPIKVSTLTGEGLDEVVKAIAAVADSAEEITTITGDLVVKGDVVMLVMPQDEQAPKGRLILPQAQTIRELLDKQCVVVSCQPEYIEDAINSLSKPPKLIITDSQAFKAVSEKVPPQSKLTSFSILFARYKGDVAEFIDGASAIDRLTGKSRILIAEACTHAPDSEDIGRVKIPAMLRSKVGDGLRVDVVGGADFPEDLSVYDLIIHCGACMFNRRHVMSRIERAKTQNVSITNYGVAIAYLMSIIDKVVYPKNEI